METTVHSIDLNVPVSTAYEQWTRFEDFPQFMEGVEEVRRLDATRLYWVANIGGTRKEWEAQITEEVPNERLGWRSEAGEFTAGLVTFQPLAAERTRVTVRFNYEPQGVMETIGDWLGLVSRRVEGDLERFKQFVETPERAYTFKHALTHEVAYDSLLHSGSGSYMPASSKALDALPGTGWLSRSNAWPTMPCGGGLGQGPGILPAGGEKAMARSAHVKP